MGPPPRGYGRAMDERASALPRLTQADLDRLLAPAPAAPPRPVDAEDAAREHLDAQILAGLTTF